MTDLTNRTIVVTGGEGFLGHHLVPLLYKKYSEVSIVKHSIYNILNINDVINMYNDFKPNVVIHLAAEVGGIHYNQANPGSLFYNNLRMGMNIIEYGRLSSIEKLVCIGTVCSYPRIPRLRFRESDLWEGYPEETNAPYGIAKRALLTMCQAYRQQYNMNCIYLMPCNLFGEFDNFEDNSAHVIPMLIKKFLIAKENNLPEVEVWGTGNATREFMYAGDAAKAIVNAVELYNKPEPVNIGTGEETSIVVLAGTIADIIGYKGKIVFDNSMPDGQPRRCLDITRMLMELEFGDELVSLEDGLRRTIKWYKENR